MITVATIGIDDVVQDLNALLHGLDGDTIDQALLVGAFVLEGEVKQQIVAMDAVDTGFLLNSVYSANSQASGYTQAQAAAESKRDEHKNPDARMADEVTAHEREAVVVIGAEYAVHVEYGTARMAARPAMRTAVDVARPRVLAAIRAVVARRLGNQVSG